MATDERKAPDLMAAALQASLGMATDKREWTEAERAAFRGAFKPPFDDLGPAGLCTCDSYPKPIEDHGEECAVRALFEGWSASRGYYLACAEAAEQRVRELGGELAEVGEDRTDQSNACAEEYRLRVEAEAKLATAVEALHRFATRWHYAGKPIAEVEKIRDEAQRALSEIEQGEVE